MDKFDLSFIKKTGIQHSEIPVGFGERKFNNNELVIMPQKFDNLHDIIKSHQEGDVATRHDSHLNYTYTFNYKTGYYTRTDYLDENQEEIGQDVFAANFPHLIDVGIMGHCTHGKSGLCLKSGVQCYQNGLSIEKPNMSVEDFRKIAEECNGFTNQFALGGRGDPNEHEAFEEILKICQENNIIPNYTTSGFGLTDEQIELTKKYCGAVAVSWYRNTYTTSSIKRFVSAGIKTNIHYVLNNNTIDEAIDMLENDKFPEGINAVVFLTHKPVGLGQKELCLKYDDPRVNRICYLIRNKKHSFKMGMDSCFVVGMINSGMNFNMKYLDTCEAARFTCYIDADLNMKPCSFDVNDQYVISIKNSSILEGWNSKIFTDVREKLHKGCPGCEQNSICHGGCPLHNDIILCSNKMKFQEEEK